MNPGALPRALAEAAGRIQAAIASVPEGTDAQKAEVHLAAALTAIREISTLEPEAAKPALASVADVLSVFQARFTDGG